MKKIFYLFIVISIITTIGCATKDPKNYNYTGVLINEDSNKTLFVRHPYQNETIVLPPEKVRYINCPKIPDMVLFRYSEEKNYEKLYFTPVPIIYDGQRFDFGVRFWIKR